MPGDRPERGPCDWCRQVRDLETAVATVHLPELSAEVKEQPAKAMRAMRLCVDCASWHETQDTILPQTGNRFPTHGAVCYADAARHAFFTKWTDDTRLDDDDLESLIEMYFDEGIRVTIERVDYFGGRGRHGFNVTLEDFPTYTIYWSDQDRSEARPEKQVILVQTRGSFHADTSAPMLRAATALAVGLNVFIRQYATCHRRYLADHLASWRARRG